ncbi:MAG: hypothetical protein WBD05_02970 [Phycisphaerae bacterium]
MTRVQHAMRLTIGWAVLAAALALITGCGPSAAEGILEVRPASAPDGTTGEPSEAAIEAHVSALTADAVLAAALARLADEGVEQTRYTGPDAADRLRRDLIIEAIPETRLISVRLPGSPPDRKAAIVRAVLQEYVERARGEQASANRCRTLEVERDLLHGQLEKVQTELTDLRKTAGLVTPNGEASESQARLQALTSLLERKQAEHEEAEARWKQFQEAKKKADETGDLSALLAALPKITETLDQEPTVVAARQKVERLQAHLDQLEARLKDEDPSVREARRALESAQKNLRAFRAALVGLLIQQEAAVLKAARDRDARAERNLKTRLTEERDRAAEQARYAEKFHAGQQEHERLRQRLAAVEQELTDLRIETALSEPPVRVVTWP